MDKKKKSAVFEEEKGAFRESGKKKDVSKKAHRRTSDYQPIDADITSIKL